MTKPMIDDLEKGQPQEKHLLVFTEQAFYELSRYASNLCHEVKNEGLRLYYEAV